MTRRKETSFIQICHQYLCSKILSSLGSRDDPGMAQWWEHSPPTNVARVWFPASYVGGVCCWFSPCSDILNILNSNSIWIEDLHENQLQLMWLSSVYIVLYLFTINPWQSNDSPQRFFFCIVQMSRLQHHLRFRLQLHLQFSLVEVVDICFVSTICRSYYVMKWPRKEWNRYLLASTASWVQELGGGG